MESSIQGKVIRELIAHFSSDLLIGKKIKSGDLRKKLVKVEPHWRCPESFSWTEIHMKNFTMDWLVPEENNRDKVVLQLHGGGYIAGMRNAYRTFGVVYSELGGNISVLTPDYRVAPEHPFPAALEDALAAFNWLLEQGYAEEDIILAGDSAGGNLALVLCLRLRGAGRRLPGGLVLFSPWTDMTMSGPSYGERAAIDPMLTANYIDAVRRAYAPGEDFSHPELSPLFGDLSGFPRTLVQVGDHEILFSDAQRLAEALRRQNVPARLEVSEGMWHVFQMFPSKKAAAALQSVARFLLEE